jgi:DNA-binding NarL/FixJ family response regulator
MATLPMSRASPLAVLIADDSPPVADMLRELITQPGEIEVVGVADSGDTVVEAIRQLHPDVVILDLQLKTGSGTDVIRKVRGEPALAGTCILVTSNHTSPQLRAGCLELGAEGYFDKVKELGALTERLRALAAQRAAPPRS